MFSKFRKKIKLFFKKITKSELTESDLDDVLWDLQVLLMENDVALSVAEKICEQLKERLIGTKLSLKEGLDKKSLKELKSILLEMLCEKVDFIDLIRKNKKPKVILFLGINGTGKTTTIAKIAHLLLKNNLSCIIAASDTFRAGSIEQIKKHAKKLGVRLIKHDYGADPAAVAFDAIKSAESKKIDAVLVDTAGRVHTNANLMRELEKINRVTKPDIKIFVGDSLTGNDAVKQAKKFNKAIGIDGSILTKIDADVKGGAAISIAHVTSKPIYFLGVGQTYDDLEVFDKYEFIDMLID